MPPQLKWKTYADMKAKILGDRREFGTPHEWRGVYAHLMPDDTILFAYQGHRIGEILPDDSHFIIIPAGYTAGVMTRWASIFGCELSARKQKKANGKVQYKIKATTHAYVDRKMVYTELGEATAVKRFQLGLYGTIDPADQYASEYEKDVEKYREFCAKVKKIRTITTAKVRMDAMKKFLDHRTLNEETAKLFPNTSIYSWGEGPKLLDSLVRNWNETPDHLHAITILCFKMHGSTVNGNDDLRRRIINGLAAAQVRYLRDECVTITESAPPKKDSDDSNRELLANDGLREVQVPREAEVRGQDSGAREGFATG